MENSSCFLLAVGVIRPSPGTLVVGLRVGWIIHQRGCAVHTRVLALVGMPLPCRVAGGGGGALELDEHPTSNSPPLETHMHE